MGDVFRFGARGGGLVRRRAIEGREAILRRLKQARGPMALLIVTPAALAGVNRIYDHEAGDALFAAMSDGVLAAAPDGAVVARLSGAKVALVLPADTPEEAAAAAGLLIDALADVEGGPAPDPRAGVAWATLADAADNGPAVIAAALGALDRAKSGGGEVEISIADHAASREELGRARYALDAIRAGRTSIALQPVVAAGATTRMMFREALIRIAGPDGDMIPAGLFMPALDRLGLTEEADVAVLRLAFAALTREPALRVSVNLSGAAITRRRWPEAFTELAAAAPDCAARLIVEVTEEATLTRVGAAIGLFTLIRAHGAALALDDFGAGRTSFSHLRDFRFDMVKIDGAFIKGIDGSADNRMLVSALVAIARQFDMMVIAEFVETAAEAETLRGLGVDGFQGYLYGRPSLAWADGSAAAKTAG